MYYNKYVKSVNFQSQTQNIYFTSKFISLLTIISVNTGKYN